MLNVLIFSPPDGPKLPSVSVSPSAEIVEGSSVTLTCSSDANPAANYTWYKENEDSPKASGQIFTITDVRPEHSGNYYCEAQNKIGSHNSTLHLTVVKGKLYTHTHTHVYTAQKRFICFLLVSFFREISVHNEHHQVYSGGPDADSSASLDSVDEVKQLRKHPSIYFLQIFLKFFTS